MKTLLSLPAATHLLATDFARQRANECRTCIFPTPLWGPAPDGNAGLWYLWALKPCAHGCHTLVAQIWADFTSTHDIAYSPIHQGRPRVKRARKVHARG